MDDGYSAGTIERPALQRLLKDAEDDRFDVVLVHRLDRFSRSVLDLYALLKTLEQHEVGFRSATEVFDTTSAVGRLFMTLVAALAQWERETIQERTRMGMEQVAREGRWKGGPVTFGYTYDPAKDDHLQVDPVAAETVRLIYSLYIDEEMGYNAIAVELDRLGIPTPKNTGSWHLSTVRQTLKNPIYAGYMPYRKVLYEGRHEAVIPRERWQLAQKIRKQRTKNLRPPRQRSLLSGLITCSECGGDMRMKKAWTNWREVKRGTQDEKKHTDYYVCYNFLGDPKHKVTGKCSAAYRRCEVVEENVIGALRQFAFEPQLIDEALAEAAASSDQQKARASHDLPMILKRLEDVESRLRKWYDAFESGDLPIGGFRDRVRELEVERERLLEQATSIEQVTSSVNQNHNITDEMRRELSSLPTILTDLDQDELRQIIERLVHQITVYPDGSVNVKLYL